MKSILMDVKGAAGIGKGCNNLGLATFSDLYL
jgi:hypothetical protein